MGLCPRRCGCCCCCCFCPRRAVKAGVPALSIFLVLLEVYLRWQFNAAAKTIPHLKPLPVIDEKDLSRDKFYKEYVLKRRPVVIRLTQPDLWNSTRAIEHCGNQKSTHVSRASFTVINQARNWLVVRLLFEWIFLPLLGMWTTLEEQLDIRSNVPLNSYVSYAERRDAEPGQKFSLGLPLFLLRILPTKLFLMLDYFKRPRYLHDIPLKKVCEAALDWIHVPRYVTPNWWFLRYEGVNEREYLDEPTFFMGKALAASYGMHQNIRWDFDFFLMVLQGQKRYSMFDPTERDNLAPTDLNVPVYMANPFDPDLVATPRLEHAKGWLGNLKAGEILYSPGDTIHSFENYDYERPTVAVKFWYTDHTAACYSDEKTGEKDCAKVWGKGAPLRRKDGADAPTIRQYIRDGMSKRARVDSLREVLPAGWESMVDPRSGHRLYFSRLTGAAQWERPQEEESFQTHEL